MAVQTPMLAMVWLHSTTWRHAHKNTWHFREKGSFYFSGMVLHSFHSPWTESQNSNLPEEEIKRANWARPSQVEPWENSLKRPSQVEPWESSVERSIQTKPWENSLERQEEQTPLQFSARDVALAGLLLSFLAATIIGPVKAFQMPLAS